MYIYICMYKCISKKEYWTKPEEGKGKTKGKNKERGLNSNATNQHKNIGYATQPCYGVSQ